MQLRKEPGIELCAVAERTVAADTQPLGERRAKAAHVGTRNNSFLGRIPQRRSTDTDEVFIFGSAELLPHRHHVSLHIVPPGLQTGHQWRTGAAQTVSLNTDLCVGLWSDEREIYE